MDTFGTGKVDENKLEELVRKNFSLTPKGIIEGLICGSRSSRRRRLMAILDVRETVYVGEDGQGGCVEGRRRPVGLHEISRSG